MRKDHEVGLLFKLLVNGFHIGVHLGADSFAGGKEILYNSYFSQQIPVGKREPLLVGKMKRLYITDDRQLFLPHIVIAEKEIVKSHYKGNKEKQVPQKFLAHDYN